MGSRRDEDLIEKGSCKFIWEETFSSKDSYVEHIPLFKGIITIFFNWYIYHVLVFTTIDSMVTLLQ